jgi:type IV pilus assembly protein PilV
VSARRTSQQGFGLVEVLIAITIFLVALVGGAALLTNAKQSEFDSHQRTLATQIGNTIVDRVRTNVGAASSYHRALGSPIGRNALGATPSNDCVASTCNATQLAAYDLWDIEQLLDGNKVMSGTQAAGGLVLPAACIVLTPSAGMTNTGRLQVVVSWEDRRATRDAAAATVTCGAGGNNAYRRQVVLDTYVLDPAEL